MLSGATNHRLAQWCLAEPLRMMLHLYQQLHQLPHLPGNLWSHIPVQLLYPVYIPFASRALQFPAITLGVSVMLLYAMADPTHSVRLQHVWCSFDNMSTRGQQAMQQAVDI